MVLFCSQMGAGIALVAWYPSLCGSLGFAINLVIVAGTAVIAERAVMETAQQTKASTFSELCTVLPSYMKSLTEISTILWQLTIVALYEDFVFNAVDSLVFGGQANRLFLFSVVGIATFAVTLPTSFSGPAMTVVNRINFAATWIVIVLAVLEGVRTMRSVDASADTRTYTVLKLDVDFVKVTALLAGAMINCASMPQLNVEIRQSLQASAAFWVPFVVAVVQASVFLIVGFAGYFALGDAVERDVFKTYARDRPGEIVILIQLGIFFMMFLSIPLVALPAKLQLWTMTATRFSLASSETLSTASASEQVLFNVLIISCTTLTPMLLGGDAFTKMVTILAGTAANWLNVFLPGFVLLYSRVLPGIASGTRPVGQILTCVWVFSIAMMCLASSIFG